MSWLDPLLYAAGATSYVGSLVLTFQLGQRSRTASPPSPTVCGCTHDYALHDVDGICKAYVKRPYYMRNGGRNGYEYVSCRCQGFTGELPAHEIAERFQPQFQPQPQPQPMPRPPVVDELSDRRRKGSAAPDDRAR